MTSLSKFLEKSKKLREDATPGPWEYVEDPCNLGEEYIFFSVESSSPKQRLVRNGDYDEYSNLTSQDAKLITHEHNISETKDQMIAIMYEALKFYKSLMIDEEDCTANKALAKVEALAKRAHE